MNKILVHTTDREYKVLRPNGGCIYMSRNCFIGSFGKFIYLFDEETIFKHFRHDIQWSGSALARVYSTHEVSYTYMSQPLEEEVKIYNEIDVERYALGVITAFDFFKGMLHKRINDVIQEKIEVDLKEAM